MSQENNGCLGVFYIILFIAATVGSGILAWNWVEPEGFWQFMGFLSVWGILSTIAYLIGMGVVALFSDNS